MTTARDIKVENGCSILPGPPLALVESSSSDDEESRSLKMKAVSDRDDLRRASETDSHCSANGQEQGCESDRVENMIIFFTISFW
jgi:hypothetical protein